MEFAAAALTSIAETVGIGASSAGSLGAAAGGAAGASSGLLPALGSTSTWLSVLQGGATVGSMLATIRSGNLDAAGKLQQADEAEADAKLEEIKGLERRASLRKNLIAAIAERDVAAAASGVDLSFGTPSVARQQAIADTDKALAIDSSTEIMRKQRLLQRADTYRWMAGETKRGKLAQTAGIGMTGALSIAQRG